MHHKDISYSTAVEKIESGKPKSRFTTRLYAWLCVLLVVFTVFMFWFNRGDNRSTANLITGLVAALVAFILAIVVFIRFIRSRSITGGLFLTTCISTGVFLATSQFIPIIVPPTAAAFTNNPEFTNNGFQLLIVLAQVGLFALWFGFLLFTIYLYVKPVKRIDKYLSKIVDGEEIKKVRIGHAHQYKIIEEKIHDIYSLSNHNWQEVDEK